MVLRVELCFAVYPQERFGRRGPAVRKRANEQIVFLYLSGITVNEGKYRANPSDLHSVALMILIAHRSLALSNGPVVEVSCFASCPVQGSPSCSLDYADFRFPVLLPMAVHSGQI